MKKIILILILFTAITSSIYAGYKSFTQYGVQFLYPDGYKITARKFKSVRKIFAYTEGTFFAVQIYSDSFNKKDKVKYIRFFLKERQEKGFTVLSSESSIDTIQVMINKKKVALPSMVQRIVLKQNQNKVVWNFHFFSNKNKGYILSESYVVGYRQKEEFQKFSDSFTIHQ